MAAHRIPYVASISLAHLDDTLRKMEHAVRTRGFRFLHILSPCPTGWKSEPADGLELIRDAVASGLYPVYEVRDGDQFLVNIEPDFSAAALEKYVSLQGRFQKAERDLTELRDQIRSHWVSLRSLVKEEPR